jgi:hypothetical protein
LGDRVVGIGRQRRGSVLSSRRWQASCPARCT